MSENHLLFGRPIISSGKLTLTEQIYDILCEEIHIGRWELEGQLPSISTMAEESGLSRRPIQLALDKIREDGYVRQERGSGTFLISLLPKGKTPIGTIGILVYRHDAGDTTSLAYQELDQWRIHAILKEAAERNYTEEIKYIDEVHEEVGIDKHGGLFSDRVKGIISIHDFSHKDLTLIPPENIPLVFLGYANFSGKPCVALDLEEGFYQLTKEVIGQGHRSIVCFGAEEYPAPGEMANFFSGYERAMKEAHLSVHYEAFQESLKILPGQLSMYREYIERYIKAADKADRENTPTAFVCSKCERATNIIAVADMMGIRVPEDLSIVSLVAGPMRAYKPDQRITGIEYDLEHTVRLCFDLLFDQMRTRKSLISVVRVKPLIKKGESLAPPRHVRAAVQAGVDA